MFAYLCLILFMFNVYLCLLQDMLNLCLLTHQEVEQSASIGKQIDN